MLEEELKGVTAPLASATTLPRSAYTSTAVFDAELRDIFYREWICVARLDQLPQPGDYLTVDVAEQPLIVVRLESGQVHAMSSICAHRAMPVVTDKGTTSHFQCPYHRWKYDLAGKLISAPYMDGAEDFPPETCRLTPVKLETWQGFIFVNLDAAAQSLVDRLGELDPFVNGYQMEDLVVVASTPFDSPWNWKLLIENFMEAYHHIGPHKESVQPEYHAHDSYSSGSIENGWSVLHMPAARKAEDESLPRQEILASLIMPCFAWLNTASATFWYQVQPLKNNQFHLWIHSLLPREIAQGPDGEEVTEAVQSTINNIHLEDIVVNKGPFHGLQAPLTKPGRLSPLEKSIWQFNQWWVQRIITAPHTE